MEGCVEDTDERLRGGEVRGAGREGGKQNPEGETNGRDILK